MLTLTIRGLTHGDGTNRILTRASNPWSVPDLEADYIRRGSAHGLAGGVELLGGRHIVAMVAIAESSMALALASLREVSAAWAASSEDIDLTWEDPLGSWLLHGRPQLAAPNMENAGVGLIEVECRFLATDPIIYSATEVTGSTGRSREGTGFTPPFTPPFTLGESEGGTIRLSNVGTAAAPWTATLTGPLTNPVITNLTTGDVLDFRANGGLDLASGDTVTLNSTGQSVLLNGSADRSDLLDVSSRWWLIEPGFTDIELAADSGDHADALTISTRDGYW